MKEYILCAAIHCDDKRVHKEQPENIERGFVVAGRRHSDCYAVIEALVGVDEYFKRVEIKYDRNHQGFITNLNRYVGRKEAFNIAKEANQLLNPKLVDPDMEFLISENLY